MNKKYKENLKENKHKQNVSNKWNNTKKKEPKSIASSIILKEKQKMIQMKWLMIKIKKVIF